jgi:hypothetical protein
MTNLTSQHIWLSLFLTSCGTVGGWALTGKIAGDEAALSFFEIGLMAVITIFCVQVLFFKLGKSRLIFFVAFNIAFGCGFVWFTLCLFLPIFWVPYIRNSEKILLLSCLGILCVANVLKATSQFKEKWQADGEKVLLSCYNVRNNAVDWPKVLASMRFSLILYIPGFSERIIPFVSFTTILLMLSGLSLRNVFPVFSVYAWGIPSCLVISMFAQIIGLALAQLIKLIALEKRFGGPIRPKSCARIG